MLDKPQQCQGCALYQIGKGFSEPEGTGSIPLLIVGESLGYNEVQAGLPFRPNAQAGSVLHRVLQKARIPRNSVAMWNLIGCQPPENKLDSWYEYKAINHCRVYFDHVVEKFKPKVILALGALPFKHLTGMEGYKLNISTVRGYVFECTRYPDILVVPSYHPSYIRRGNLNLMGLLLMDLVKATYIAQGKPMSYMLNPEQDPSLDYLLHPTIEQIKDFYEQCKADPSLLIALDVENPKSGEEDEEEREMENQTITQIQFSIKPSSGIALKWTDETIPVIRDICQLPNPKVNHNLWQYDRLVLRNHDIILKGEQFDTQWMAHHFQADVPIGLQPVASWFNWSFPWKHLSGSDFEFYGIADADSSRQLYYNLKGALEKRGMWGEYDEQHRKFSGYYGLVQGLEPILVRIQDRGLPINVEKQQAFGLEIEQLDEKGKLVGGRKLELMEEINAYIPEEFERVNKVGGYKRVPREVEQCKLEYMLEKGNSNAVASEDYIFEKTGFILREFIIDGEYTKDELELMKLGVQFTDKEVKKEKRWVKRLGFNPNSPTQISDLIKMNGHEEMARKLTVNLKRDYDNELGGEFSRLEIEAFKDSNSDKNVSTSKILLKKLAEKTGNKVYKLIVEFKELSKIKGTYIDGYKPQTKQYICSECKGYGEIGNAYYMGPSSELGDYSKSKGFTNINKDVVIESMKCIVCKGKGIIELSRIHTTYTFRPANWQLSSRNPNVQNYPVHSNLAKRFKECIEAAPGRVLVSLDYRGFHNKMMGFLAMDAGYLRIASFDTHSFVTGHVVSYPGIEMAIGMSDEALIEYLTKIKKQYKKLRDDQIKHVVHGINFGLGEAGCYKRYMEDFSPTREEIFATKTFRKEPSEEQIAKLIEAAGKKKVKVVYDVVKGLFPKIFQWQHKTIIEADTKGFIQTPFGARRWFFATSEVKYDRFGNSIEVKKGEQAEQALAFPVSNNAHGHMRESMVLLELEGLNEKYRLVNMVHDSLVYEPLAGQVEECVTRVKEIMERKSTILKNELMPEGFWCSVDAKVGKNMAEMD